MFFLHLLSLSRGPKSAFLIKLVFKYGKTSRDTNLILTGSLYAFMLKIMFKIETLYLVYISYDGTLCLKKKKNGTSETSKIESPS